VGQNLHSARRFPIVAGACAVDWSRTYRLGSHDVLAVANGAGSLRAASALDAVADTFLPDAVISTGFCGALDPQLRVADVVVATSVVGRIAATRRSPSRPPPLTTAAWFAPSTMSRKQPKRSVLSPIRRFFPCTSDFISTRLATACFGDVVQSLLADTIDRHLHLGGQNTFSCDALLWQGYLYGR